MVLERELNLSQTFTSFGSPPTCTELSLNRFFAGCSLLSITTPRHSSLLGWQRRKPKLTTVERRDQPTDTSTVYGPS